MDTVGKGLPVVWTADRWRFDAEGRKAARPPGARGDRESRLPHR